MNRFDILFQDDHFIAIHKPPGIHVHPTPLAKGETSCTQILKNELGQKVYSVHRLDRATSGVLLFALHADAARKVTQLFTERLVKKIYWAVVRGFVDSEGRIDHPLREDRYKERVNAVTEYRCLATVELPYPVGKFATARYSMVEIYPQTGRKNQIRKHFNKRSHPIIGDGTYGDNKHNRFFREQFGTYRLLLIAKSLSFEHPFTQQRLTIEAPLPEDIGFLMGTFQNYDSFELLNKILY